MGFVVSGLSGLGSSSFSGRRVSVGRRSVACVGRGRVGSLAGLSMIASFGPHRWEIGSEFEEDYEYTYLIDVPESLHDVTILDIDLRRMDLSMLKGEFPLWSAVKWIVDRARTDSFPPGFIG